MPGDEAVVRSDAADRPRPGLACGWTRGPMAGDASVLARTDVCSGGHRRGHPIHLLVVGDNDADMALAAKTLVECGGGECAVEDGKILGQVALPICGLMSPRHVEDVAADVEKVEEAWKSMGCTMPSPFMTMGLMSLACIPVLRQTNRGYVNCVSFQTEPLIVEETA